MIHVILVSVWYTLMGVVTFWDFITTAGIMFLISTAVPEKKAFLALCGSTASGGTLVL